MRKSLITLVCALLALGGGVWIYNRCAGQKIASKEASQQKRPVVVAIQIPSPEPKQPKLAITASPVPVKESPEPPRHVARAGTVTKDELFSAIKKDARVYSDVWMDLLGAPAFTKPTGWSKLYCWKDKLDVGGDSPIGIAVEVADYKGDLIAVGVYDAESKSITPLPWRNKVAATYNDAMQWYYNDQANQVAIAAQNRQLEIYKQAAAGATRWEQSQKSQYVSPLSSTARNVGAVNYDQTPSTGASNLAQASAVDISTPPAIVIHNQGAVTGHGRTKEAAYADAMSLIPKGAVIGQQEARAVPFANDGQGPGGGWDYRIETTQNH